MSAEEGCVVHCSPTLVIRLKVEGEGGEVLEYEKNSKPHTQYNITFTPPLLSPPSLPNLLSPGTEVEQHLQCLSRV